MVEARIPEPDLAAPPDQALSLGSIDYPGGFYSEQAPIHLKFICALNGVPTPSIDTGFSYCELGCGTGDTTCLLAATNDAGRFVGIDLSATHIEAANGMAREGELHNVRFINADILNLDPDSLPEFDFVTLHGLYSWVPEAVQRAIRRFLGDKLRPGGVAYVSYNAMPGWGSVEGLRRYFIDTVPHRNGTLIERTRAALQDLKRFCDSSTPYFQNNPCAAAVVSRLMDADIRYVAHEYLAESWTPLHFADVARQMSEVGLHFVGSGRVIENLLEHSVRPEFIEPLQQQADLIARESLRDFIQNRFFRGDVFIKAAPRSQPVGGDELLRDMLFGLIAAPVQIPAEIELPDAPALRFEGEWFEQLKRRLGFHALSLSELLADDALRRCPPQDLVDGIKLLSSGGMLIPFARHAVTPARGPVERIQVVPRLNRLRLARHDWSQPGLVLGSPVTGSGVVLNGLEAAMLTASQRDEALSWLVPEMQARGVPIKSIRDGTRVEGEAALRDALAEALGQFHRHKLPKLAYLGIVEGA